MNGHFPFMCLCVSDPYFLQGSTILESSTLSFIFSPVMSLNPLKTWFHVPMATVTLDSVTKESTELILQCFSCLQNQIKMGELNFPTWWVSSPLELTFEPFFLELSEDIQRNNSFTECIPFFSLSVIIKQNLLDFYKFFHKYKLFPKCSLEQFWDASWSVHLVLSLIWYSSSVAGCLIMWYSVYSLDPCCKRLSLYVLKWS